MQNHWHVSPDRGFLIEPDPITDLSEINSTLAEIEGVASEMPDLLKSGRMRERLEQIPLLELSEIAQHSKHPVTQRPNLPKGLNDDAQAAVVEVEPDEISPFDFRMIERLWVLYTYFANAYVFATPENPVHHITKSVAVPLHQLAQMVERPPIFSYVTLVLNNWRRIDPDGPITLDNITALQHFLGIPDEHWFGLVHVNVEFCAAGAVRGIEAAIQGAVQGDTRAVEQALNTITDSLGAMLKAFGRMTHGCDPDIYYRDVRPYMFGFENVVYEGVMEYGGQPQSFRSGSGAQSSVIPAIIAALGIQHEQTGLMKHLDVMKVHMPKAHRDFISRVTTTAIRDFVKQANDGALTDAYNGCIREMMTFRKAHFHYARIYIFDKVDNPVGTGGTLFMDWLSRLIAETEAHLL